MIGITGIGTPGEPHATRPASGNRTLPVNDLRPTGTDAVAISPAGHEAAEAARFIRESAGESEIRQEQVETAKRNLNEGRQRVEEVLNAVAEALVRYI